MHKQWYLLVVLLFSSPLHAAELVNGLKQHPSPYLAMHGDDPVAWQQWNEATVSRARRENKLLFVSSGYFSCHWCHVMQKESYQNEKIAHLLNRHFIPVKVDRELDGALDARLIDFVEKTQGIAGWPLNVFITPEGYPLVGMVYVPAGNFSEILEKLNQQWQQSQADLLRLAREATVQLEQAVPTQVISKLSAGDLRQVFSSAAWETADILAGGFGEANKFPSVPQLETLLVIYQQQAEPQLEQFLTLTLDRMNSQGLKDHLSGGFFRYAVDPAWQIPHFEKMLYDNALMARLYLQAGEVFRQDSYHDVARQTLDFMISNLQTASGGMLASFSAIDERGIEGGYYLWNNAELEKILDSKTLRTVSAVWGIDENGDLNGEHHLVLSQDPRLLSAKLSMTLQQLQETIEHARQQLLKQRSKRKLPVDHKQLAGWNGLALSAMAKAAQHYKEEKYRLAMRRLRDFLTRQLWREQSLYRARGDNGFEVVAELEDYAFVAEGLWYSLQVENDKYTRETLHSLLQQAWQKFHDKRGWKLKENNLMKYGEYQPAVMDGPLPSPVAVLVNVSRLYAEKYTDRNLLEQATSQLTGDSGLIIQQPFWYATEIRNRLQYQSGS